MDHPMVERIERTGFPYSDRREVYGEDPFGNEVFAGDEILKLEDEFFLVDELSEQTKEALEAVGATYMIAK